VWVVRCGTEYRGGAYFSESDEDTLSPSTRDVNDDVLSPTNNDDSSRSFTPSREGFTS